MGLGMCLVCVLVVLFTYYVSIIGIVTLGEHGATYFKGIALGVYWLMYTIAGLGVVLGATKSLAEVFKL